MLPLMVSTPFSTVTSTLSGSTPASGVSTTTASFVWYMSTGGTMPRYCCMSSFMSLNGSNVGFHGIMGILLGLRTVTNNHFGRSKQFTVQAPAILDRADDVTGRDGVARFYGHRLVGGPGPGTVLSYPLPSPFL